jgi:hypothetical protein
VRTYRFDDFSAVVSDGEGVVETFAAERLVETVLPLETGCVQDDATLDLDGALAVQRRGGVNVALRAADLHLELSGTGSAGRCSRRIEASGRLTIDDHSALRHNSRSRRAWWKSTRTAACIASTVGSRRLCPRSQLRQTSRWPRQRLPGRGALTRSAPTDRAEPSASSTAAYASMPTPTVRPKRTPPTRRAGARAVPVAGAANCGQ